VIVVPMEELSPDVVTALIEEFVTRSGAIQGEEVSLEARIEQVRRMLNAGKAVIVWDEQNEATSVMTREELTKWEAGDRQVVEEDPGDRRYEDEG